MTDAEWAVMEPLALDVEDAKTALADARANLGSHDLRTQLEARIGVKVAEAWLDEARAVLSNKVHQMFKVRAL